MLHEMNPEQLQAEAERFARTLEVGSTAASILRALLEHEKLFWRMAPEAQDNYARLVLNGIKARYPESISSRLQWDSAQNDEEDCGFSIA